MKKGIAIIALIVGAIAPANAEETIYCQGMVCSTTPPDESKFATFEMKDDTGKTVSTFVGHVDYFTQPNIKTESNHTVCANCNITLQPQPVYVEPIPRVILDSSTAVTDTTTVLIDTSTATITNVTIDSIYEQIMALFTQLLALIAKLNR
jgi:hypothetical protein